MKRIALFLLLLNLGFVVGCQPPAKPKEPVTPATDPATTTGGTMPDKEKPAEDMPEDEPATK